MRLPMRGGAAVALLWMTLTLAPITAAPMTEGERQRLVVHLEMTGRWLADEVADLSPAQLAHRTAPGTWSILNVVEHLAVAEPQYWKQLQDSVREKPKEDWKRKATDEAILWYGIDRTARAKTAEAREPTGEAKDIQPVLAAVQKLRSTMLDYARMTQDDLRGHAFLTSTMDTYQWFLMISTHMQRHILQVREIKAHPSFPKA